MRSLYYDWNTRPITAEQWHALMREPRTVDVTDLGPLGRVSTVWLGMDHGYGWWDGSESPLIFETLVFDGPLADEMLRYATLEDALRGHDFMVLRLTSLTPSGGRRRPLIHNGGKPRR